MTFRNKEVESIYNYIKDKEIEEIVQSNLKSKLEVMYIGIYETPPLTSYNKVDIARRIINYFKDLKRTEKLIG